MDQSFGREVHQQTRDAFSAVLKEARTQLGVSQQKLADAAQMDRSYLSMLERGKQQPSLAMLLRIANALGIGAPHLVERTLERLHAA